LPAHCFNLPVRASLGKAQTGQPAERKLAEQRQGRFAFHFERSSKPRWLNRRQFMLAERKCEDRRAATTVAQSVRLRRSISLHIHFPPALPASLDSANPFIPRVLVRLRLIQQRNLTDCATAGALALDSVAGDNSATMLAIEIENLTQDYQVGFWRKRAVRALDGLSLQVERGEVFGFLGPNGAGKTTAFKVLMRLLRPTAGTARILGCALDDLAMRAQIGYLPEQPYFYDYLTAREFLLYCGSLCDLTKAGAQERATRLLAQVGLARDANQHLRKYSKGMLQRVGLAQALINDPSVLFLDEPMSGLDPLGRRAVRELLETLRAEGKTVFFSTHILSDVEALCDRVAIIQRGRLIEAGKLAEILKTQSNELEAALSGLSEAAVAELRLLAVAVTRTPAGTRVRLRGEQDLPRLLAISQRDGGHLLSVNPVRESLEELFVREVGGNSPKAAA
jgi:ABC-2 type transport system ATP-binding protein